MRLQIKKTVIMIILLGSFLYSEVSTEMIDQWLKGGNAATKEIAVKEIGKRKLEKYVPVLKELLMAEPKIEVRYAPRAKKKGPGRPEARKVIEETESDMQKRKEVQKIRVAAAVALGSFKGDKEAVTLLCGILYKSREQKDLRIACIRSLGTPGRSGKEELAALIFVLNELEPEPDVMIEVIDSLEKIGDPVVQYLLADVLKVDYDKEVRKKALAAITKIGNKKIVRELEQSKEDNKKDEFKEIIPLIEKAIEKLKKKQ